MSLCQDANCRMCRSRQLIPDAETVDPTLHVPECPWIELQSFYCRHYSRPLLIEDNKILVFSEFLRNVLHYYDIVENEWYIFAEHLMEDEVTFKSNPKFGAQRCVGKYGHGHRHGGNPAVQKLNRIARKVFGEYVIQKNAFIQVHFEEIWRYAHKTSHAYWGDFSKARQTTASYAQAKVMLNVIKYFENMQAVNI